MAASIVFSQAVSKGLLSLGEAPVWSTDLRLENRAAPADKSALSRIAVEDRFSDDQHTEPSTCCGEFFHHG
jgi:hypothetical protein